MSHGRRLSGNAAPTEAPRSPAGHRPRGWRCASTTLCWPPACGRRQVARAEPSERGTVRRAGVGAAPARRRACGSDSNHSLADFVRGRERQGNPKAISQPELWGGEGVSWPAARGSAPVGRTGLRAHPREQRRTSAPSTRTPHQPVTPVRDLSSCVHDSLCTVTDWWASRRRGGTGRLRADAARPSRHIAIMLPGPCPCRCVVAAEGGQHHAYDDRSGIALAAAAGFLALGSSGASAGPPHPAGLQAGGQGAAVQTADWYCGPRCQYWRHRHWEERHWSGYYRPHHWRQYGYYRPHRHYPYAYAY